MNDNTVKAIWGLVIALAIAGVLSVCFLVGITTHESHLRDLQYAHQEMQKCIASDRTAAECRVLVYGSY